MKNKPTVEYFLAESLGVWTNKIQEAKLFYNTKEADKAKTSLKNEKFYKKIQVYRTAMGWHLRVLLSRPPRNFACDIEVEQWLKEKTDKTNS